jgi:hypothetical protein
LTSTDTNTDPIVFRIEIINQFLNSQFVLSNNIETTQESKTFEFINPGNINDIFATSAPFSI